MLKAFTPPIYDIIASSNTPLLYQHKQLIPHYRFYFSLKKQSCTFEYIIASGHVHVCSFPLFINCSSKEKCSYAKRKHNLIYF